MSAQAQTKRKPGRPRKVALPDETPENKVVTVGLHRAAAGWVVRTFEIVGDKAKMIDETEADVFQYAFDTLRTKVVRLFWTDTQ